MVGRLRADCAVVSADLPSHLPHPAGLTARFAALLDDDGPASLEDACVVAAAHLAPGADADGTDLTDVRARLDTLAVGVTRRDLEGVVTHLVAEGFGGRPQDYAAAESSLLPAVLRRRRGLPILLAVVAQSVGRRVDVDLDLIGLPGHVLVAGADDPARLADPFHRHPSLDPAGARDLFQRIHGDAGAWRPEMLAPMSDPEVVARILANLANRFRTDSRHREEAVVLGLRAMVPGVPIGERGALAAALARSGAFDRAAAELEGLAEQGVAGIDADALRRKAERWRARLN